MSANSLKVFKWASLWSSKLFGVLLGLVLPSISLWTEPSNSIVLLKSEMQKKMFAEVSEDYLVNYIDYPYIPEIQSAPNKKVIVIFGVFFSNLIFILFLLGFVLFKTNRKKWKLL